MEKDDTEKKKRKRKAEHVNGEVPRKKSQVRWKMLLSLTPALMVRDVGLLPDLGVIKIPYPTTFHVGSAIAHPIRVTAVEGGEERSSERTCHAHCY